MTHINIYEQPPVVELSVHPQPLCSGAAEDQLRELKELFQIELLLNETPLRAVQFSEQYIDSRWALVYDDDNSFILQSAYLKPESLINSILAKGRRNATKLNSGFIYFMAYNHDYANYYHWTIQCLPAISLYLSIRNLYPNLKLLLPANLPGFAVQYLELLHIDAQKEVEFIPIQDKVFFADNLIYPSLLGGEFAFNTSRTMLSFSTSVFEKYIKNGTLAARATGKADKKILYCSRLDSQNRVMINEKELISLLEEKFKARVFTSTGQSIKEQAKMFYESDVIISPHGAGLSNVVYCRANTSIIEFMPDKYINPCYAALAVNKGCRYYPYVFQTRAFEGHQHNYEWEVDINQIDSLLIKII